MHHEQLKEATPGMNVGFNVKNLGVKDLKRGYVMSYDDDNKAMKTNSFVAQVIVTGKRKNKPIKIHEGYTPVLDCHTSHIASKFENILEVFDSRGKKVETEAEKKEVSTGFSANINIVPTKEFVCEPFKEYPSLGRFAVRDMKMTVAVGVVTTVEKADLKKEKKK